MLAYLVQKDKPLSYIETHAGRGLYDLISKEAEKTGEAIAGIESFLSTNAIPDNHPYISIIAKLRKKFGSTIYPGSPIFAANILRSQDSIHLAELHPQEVEHLRRAMAHYKVNIHQKDGLKIAGALIPPTPRRGVLLIDPSYELKDEYMKMANFVSKMSRKWPVGVITLWYPILPAGAHKPMLEALQTAHTDALCHEVFFKNTNQNHRMQGSGLFIVNPPYGTKEHCRVISSFFNIKP
jgi:23S rRNA (adenine2030-N6)-methyltransferase